MAERFRSAFFRKSDKAPAGEQCFISNYTKMTDSTSSGDSISLGEIFIISSILPGARHEIGDRVDEEGMWDVECVPSKKKRDVYLVKRALRAHDSVKLEKREGFLNIVINGKLGIYWDENGQEHKLGYTRGGRYSTSEVMSFFYKKVSELRLSPKFSVIEFEREFKSITDEVNREPGNGLVFQSDITNPFSPYNPKLKKKRPRIRK